VTLPTFAAERLRLLHGTRSAPAVSDRHLLQTRRPSLLLSIDGTDRRTPDRYIDHAGHTMRAVSITAQSVEQSCYSKNLYFKEYSGVFLPLN